MGIGQRVRDQRVQQNFTQEELAERAGLSHATISRVESGAISEMKSEALKRLATALGVSMDYLAGRTDELSIRTHHLSLDRNTLLHTGEFRRLTADQRDTIAFLLDHWLGKTRRKRIPWDNEDIGGTSPTPESDSCDTPVLPEILTAERE